MFENSDKKKVTTCAQINTYGVIIYTCILHYDQYCHGFVWNNKIQQYTFDNNHELIWNYLINRIYQFNINHVWPRIIFIGYEFRKSLIEKYYWILAKPISSENPTYNEILKGIHLVLGNLLREFNIKYTYIYNDDPRLGILAATAFAISSTEKSLKGCTLMQLIFSCDTITLIKHQAYWKLIHHKIRSKWIKIISVEKLKEWITNIRL